MATQNPYTLLRESADPMLGALGPNDHVSVDPILGLIGYDPVPEQIQTSSAGEIDIFGFKSQPAIVVGQHRAYKAGNRGMDVGKAYLQFYTEQIWVDEDELERMEQNGDGSLIGRNVKAQRIRNHRYYINRVLKYAINPWEGVTTSTDYNANMIGMFMSSSTGTLTNPSDLNSTAGTPANLTSTAILSGGSQTYYNTERIMTSVIAGFAKVDYNSHDEFPWSKMYCGTHPNTYAILSTVKDLFNSTGTKNVIPYMQELEAMGITVVKSAHFYSTSAVTTGGEGRLFFFTDPLLNFKMMEKQSASKDAWSPWVLGKRETEVEGVMKISYETHRSSEIGFLPQAYHFWTAASTESYFKALYVVRICNFTT